MRLGLLGRTLAHTLSPQIHARILYYTGRQGDYGVYEKTPDELPEFLLSLGRDGFTGINVTIPYKTDAIRYLDELAPEARSINAVNTIHISDGKLIGYNTDYFGFGYMLEKARISVEGKAACILGAGGAAKAAAAYLRDAGAAVAIASRDPARAKASFAGFDVIGYEDLKGELLVNTTPLGMFPDTEGCPVDRKTMARFKAVADLVYNPRKTALVKTAAEEGLKTADGFVMLVAQAVKAEEIWQRNTIMTEIIDKIAGEM